MPLSICKCKLLDQNVDIPRALLGSRSNYILWPQNLPIWRLQQCNVKHSAAMECLVRRKTFHEGLGIRPSRTLITYAKASEGQGGIRIGQALSFFQLFKSADVHDKIYALRSVIDLGPEFSVDYNLPITSLFLQGLLLLIPLSSLCV